MTPVRFYEVTKDRVYVGLSENDFGAVITSIQSGSQSPSHWINPGLRMGDLSNKFGVSGKILYYTFDALGFPVLTRGFGIIIFSILVGQSERDFGLSVSDTKSNGNRYLVGPGCLG